AAFREAHLHGALLAFRDMEEMLLGDACAVFQECLDVTLDSVVLVGGGQGRRRLTTTRPITQVSLKVPSHGERLHLWRSYLGRGSALTERQLLEVAALYNLGTEGIIRVSAAAREMAEFAGCPVDRTHIRQSVRQLFDADLSTIATRVEITQTWDDLV